MPITEIQKGADGQVASRVIYDGGTQAAMLVVLSDANGAPVFSNPQTPSAGTDRSAVVGVASQQLMAASATRSKFFVKNDTAIAVYINMGATAVATPGGGNIMIAANGGYFEFSGYTGVVNIVAASGTPAITAREF